MSKPREIEISYGYEGQLMWPVKSPKHEVKETILFREVVPIDFEKVFAEFERKTGKEIKGDDRQALVVSFLKQLSGEE